jgi:hypothetical protein
VAWTFELRDKTGRHIHLSEERWNHILLHPEMTNQLEPIKETLMQPDHIQSDDDRDDIHYYLKYNKQRKQKLCVVVKYLNGDGYILTSYFIGL